MTPEPGARRGGTGDVGRDDRLDRLYRETLGENPPAHLDAGILAAARREVGARPRAFPAALSRWRVPVSIAALVVLSASLVIMVREEGGDQLVGDVAIPPPAVFRPEAKPAEMPPGASAPATAPAPRPPMAESAAEPPAALRKEAATAAKAAPKPAVPSRQDGPGVLQDAPPAGGGRLAAPPRPEGPIPFPGVVGERVEQPTGPGAGGLPKAEAQPGLSVAPAAVPRAAEDAELARKRVAPRAQDQRRLRAAERAARPAAAPPPRTAMEAESTTASPEGAPARPLGAEAVTGGTPEARFTGDRGEVATLVRTLDKEPPEKWLARMRELREEGRTGDADLLLAEFKRRFPGYPLPSGLQ